MNLLFITQGSLSLRPDGRRTNPPQRGWSEQAGVHRAFPTVGLTPGRRGGYLRHVLHREADVGPAVAGALAPAQVEVGVHGDQGQVHRGGELRSSWNQQQQQPQPDQTMRPGVRGESSTVNKEKSSPSN